MIWNVLEENNDAMSAEEAGYEQLVNEWTTVDQNSDELSNVRWKKNSFIIRHFRCSNIKVWVVRTVFWQNIVVF